MKGEASRPGFVARLACAAALLWLCAGSADAARAAEDIAGLKARQAETRAEAERIARDLALSSDRIASIRKSVDALRRDSTAITAALIQSAKTSRKLADDIAAIEDRMTALKLRRDQVKASLDARADVLAEVLGALERMGLNPPPAILVRPDDALASVRSAILLGAVVPELRGETERLLADLEEVKRLAGSIAAERERLTAALGDQAAEKERLSRLAQEKAELRDRSLADMEAERRRADALAARASDLQGLIASLDQEIGAARAAEEAAAARPLPDDFRLRPVKPFGTLQGQLASPVTGTVIRHFGDPDATGMRASGDTVQTQSGAIVTAPADGSVLYAGRFRSYGELLILDAGGGYHVVLAGLAQVSVTLGQSVLAGEPVGTMGEARLASASGSGAALPELYIEFRKSGKPVDPTPWWVGRSSGRTGNDS